MWMTLWSVVAVAQVVDGDIPPIDAQLFRPSLDSQYTIWTNDSTRFENHSLMGRFTAHYTKDPLVYRFAGGTNRRVLSDILQFDAAAGYQLGPVRMGLLLPIYAYTDGEGRASSAGFGDLTLDLKGTVLDRVGKDTPIGLAIGGRVGFPTAAIEQAPLGSEGVSWEIEAIIDRDLGDKGFVAANIGYRGIPNVALENIEWQDNLIGRLGFGLKTSQLSGLSAEVVAHPVASALSEPAGIPAEVLVGGWGRAAPGLKFRGGLGTSLTQGLGAPQFRAMFALSFEPNSDPDTDGDGITDPFDECKTVPEDLDGIADLDGCPEATQVTLSAVSADGDPIETALFSITGPAAKDATAGDTIELFGGSYTAAVTAEGFLPLDMTAAVPDAETHTLEATLTPEPIVGTLTVSIVDPDGNPINGATWFTGDSGHGSGESVELEAKSYKVKVRAKGYRNRKVDALVEVGTDRALKVELQPAKAQLEGERITINESVFFELNKADIKPESFELLNEVADILLEHDEITKIRIEGHTDSRGSADSNKSLSQRRAQSVKDYLIGKTVTEDRLEAVGFGEEKPLDPGQNEEAWAKNRRVDFFVAGRR